MKEPLECQIRVVVVNDGCEISLGDPGLLAALVRCVEREATVGLLASESLLLHSCDELSIP